MPLRFRAVLLAGFFSLALSAAASAQTGKVAGTVTGTGGEVLVGVNVSLVGTTQGAVTDVDGDFSVVGVRPGTYTVLFSYIGYSERRVENVQVNVDKTTRVDARLVEGEVEGEEVLVTAERPLIEIDRTTTTATVTGEQLAALPVTNIQEAINLQAGVVDGHFRGGRSSEVTYLVNGVPIQNAFNGGAAFTIEQNMVENLEVISGVFNAEYGQALSGVVNITTKDVPRAWEATALGYVGGVASTRKLEFIERTAAAGTDLTVDDFVSRKVSYSEASPFPSQLDGQLSVGGPLLRNRLGVRVSARVLQDEGHRLARRLFNPSDRSFGLNSSAPRDRWRLGSTGDQSFVALDGGRRVSLNGALVARPTGSLRMDYNVFLQDGEGRPYRQGQKYVPDGINRNYGFSQTHIFGVAQTLSNKSFVSGAYSYLRDEGEGYLYETPTDERYVSPTLGSQAGANAFAVGGNDLFGYQNRTETHTIQADFTSQVTKVHLFKTGVQTRLHRINNRGYGLLYNDGTGETAISENPLEDNRLHTTPREFAVFAQDKIELKNLIVNVGLRFDLFDPSYQVPVDWTQGVSLRVPTGLSAEGDTLFATNRKAASIKTQFSPRLGIAFPISAAGVLRFSAGLFFQTPPFSLLFRNPEYEVATGSLAGFYGNPDINPERTLTFEAGLQQGITDELGMELTVYSKDIRNLTGTQIFQTPEGGNVVRYTNVDVGTVRGITLSMSQRPGGPLAWTLDYTLQFAEGTASDPGESFGRQQAGLEAIYSLSRLNWDRRHVINNTLTLKPARGFELTLVNRLQSGTPYTTIREFIPSFIVNDDDKPSYFTSDLRFFYRPPAVPAASLFLQVTNLTDEQVQQAVYAETGTATDNLYRELYRRNGTQVGGVNSLDEYFYDQGFFGAPRRVSLGLRLNL